MRNRHARSLASVLIAIVLLVSQALAVSAGPQLPNPGRAPLSRDQQIKLGFEAAAQVYQQMPVLPDNNPLTQYVQQLGQRLAATIPQQYSWPYQFHVIPEKEINAFALPGGAVFINAGTIAAASNEAQLAGVMAHEMSHVYMQHGAKQAGKAQTTSLIAGIAGAILGAASGSTLGQLAQAGIQFGAQGLMLRYSREDEAQADHVGAIIMYKAGYNPKALADFFEKLESQGGSGPQFLSDHPNPGNREQAIQQEIAGWPPKSYKGSSAEFQNAHQLAGNMKLYSAQEIAQGSKSGQWAKLNKTNGAVFRAPQGVAVSVPASAPSGQVAASGPVSLQNVLPSSHMVNADLGPVKMLRPDNWQVTSPSENSSGYQIAPRAGVTGNSIGYGVAINGVKPKNGETMNIDQMTEALERALESSSDLRASGDPTSIKVAGVEGRSVEMNSTSPFPDANGQPQKELDWLVTVPRSDGSVMYLVFVAPQAEFSRFRPTFESMLRSVQFQQ